MQTEVGKGWGNGGSVNRGWEKSDHEIYRDSTSSGLLYLGHVTNARGIRKPLLGSWGKHGVHAAIYAGKSQALLLYALSEGDFA